MVQKPPVPVARVTVDCKFNNQPTVGLYRHTKVCRVVEMILATHLHFKGARMMEDVKLHPCTPLKISVVVFYLPFHADASATRKICEPSV